MHIDKVTKMAATNTTSGNWTDEQVRANSALLSHWRKQGPKLLATLKNVLDSVEDFALAEGGLEVVAAERDVVAEAEEVKGLE